MASTNKKKQTKQETKAEPVLPTEPKDSVSVKTNDGQKSQIGSLRMRTRDYLDAVNKNVAIELAKQSEAAAHGKTGLVSLRMDECKALIEVLHKMEETFFMGWCADASSAANVKLKKDLAVTVAKLNGLANGTIKALSPEEKKVKAQEAAEKLAQVAKIQAELDALEASLNL